MTTIKRNFLKISNSLNIEDNIHYKRIRKLRPVNLSRNTSHKNHTNLTNFNNKTYTIIQGTNSESDSIFVFQDIRKSRSTVFLFENEEDATVFATLLEAATDGYFTNAEIKPTCLEVISEDIVALCRKQAFNCYFHPSGSLVTPMNMKL
jgi:hypothetical protein